MTQPTITIDAIRLKVGQTFDFEHHTYVVTSSRSVPRAERLDADRLEVQLGVEGSEFPMGFYYDSPVRLHVTEAEREAHLQRETNRANANARVRQNRNELAQLKASGRIHEETAACIWWDETDSHGHTRRKSREYVTTAGMLRALIRMDSDIDKYDIVDVFVGA